MTIQDLARSLVDQLAPDCERVEIAGSIRRGKPNPRDIEIVAISKMDTIFDNDIFGNITNEIQVARLNDAVVTLCTVGDWEFDPTLKRNGSKYKRLRHVDTKVCCDLFITSAECFGAIFTIRTGPGDFSKELVTRARRMGMVEEHGQLYRIHRDNSRDLIPTPEEADFFKALGLPWIEPRERTLETLASLSAHTERNRHATPNHH